MQFETVKKENILIVKPSERRLDARIAVEFKEKLIEIINEGNKNILINLEKVEFIDSSGLGAIVACLKHIGKDGDLKLCSLQPGVKSLIELTRLHRVFQIFPGEDKAFEK